MAETSTPLCQCGCGGLAPYAKQNKPSRGIKKGDLLGFIRGHALRPLRGALHPRWKGGRILNCARGIYVSVHVATSNYELEHRLIAAKALGKALPPNCVVHHVDRTGDNNVNSNLVICQDDAYHNLLHMRMRARAACGNANWWRCPYCKQYEDPELGTFTKNSRQGNAMHRLCYNAYMRALGARLKARRGMQL